MVVEVTVEEGGGQLRPSRSNVLLLELPLATGAVVVVVEDSTAEALLSSSCGRPVFGLWPVDWNSVILKR